MEHNEILDRKIEALGKLKNDIAILKKLIGKVTVKDVLNLIDK